MCAADLLFVLLHAASLQSGFPAEVQTKIDECERGCRDAQRRNQRAFQESLEVELQQLGAVPRGGVLADKVCRFSSERKARVYSELESSLVATFANFLQQQSAFRDAMSELAR